MNDEKGVMTTEEKEALSNPEISEQFRELLSTLSASEVLNKESPCDEKVIVEKQSYEISKQKIELATSTAELKSISQNIELRRKFAWAGYGMNIFWLIAILVIISFAGFRFYRFSLPDSVLLALVGTTTANVLGVLCIVMRYLFHTEIKP